MADYNSFQESFSAFILSASGIRKVFAAEGGKTASEESVSTEITAEDAAASAIIADVFGSLVKANGGSVIAVGMDARPTGPAISAVIISILETQGFQIKYTGIAAAPELMAWVKTSADIDAFAYISASHNPIGHNGFKFGFSDGAVMGGDKSKLFISKVIAAAVDEDMFSKYAGIQATIAESDVPLPDSSADKAEAEVAYRLFSDEVICAATDKQQQAAVLNRIKAVASKIGIVAELNGSARGVSIDQSYLEACGFKSIFLNDEPGNIVHPIVPEGASLNLCREELEKAHAKDSDFILGYVPDNDGDRGNIVYINDRTGCAEILEAQEVFALCVKSELEFMKQTKPGAKLAVAVNGPTSMRIERIAESYGAEVFRAEVGEANVVNLAAEKRLEGFEVRILGEGSNGGNITHPATVRDPLNTIFALVKLQIYGGFSSLTEAVESLPAFTTTSAFEPEAKMQIGSITHAELKADYENNFPAAFEAKKDWLKTMGITGWYEVNYEGTKASRGTGAKFRTGRESGGLKIMLTGQAVDSAGRAILKDIAFLWMRGSGTEPVFRVMTDIEGDNPDGMRALLDWQRSLVAEAAGC